MQVAGKSLVVGAFVLGFAMAGGAWWYNYQQSRLAAKFWGAQAATLLIGSSEVTLLQLGAPADDGVAGRAVVREIDLTGKKGLVHLRHSLTYDPNFAWDNRRRQPLEQSGDWPYALRFAKGDSKLVILFSQDFTQLGHWADDGAEVDALPCPRLGSVIASYLAQVGVSLDASADPAAPPAESQR